MSCDSVKGLRGADMWVFASSLVAYEEDGTEGSGREHGVWGVHPSTAFWTLLLTMMATPFLLRDSCLQ